MVGGWLIEIAPITLRDGRSVLRLWCVDRNGDETAVYAEPADDLPALGSEIWWQSGEIFFDHDRKRLRKIANSFDPRSPL